MEDSINFVAEYIADLKMSIKYLVSAICFVVAGIVAFFFYYRKDRKTTEIKFEKMHGETLQVMKEDIAAKIAIKNALENNTAVIKEFPGIMKDTIITTIRLASQK